MYRVSEYTYEIDFLENHNSASRQGQTAFLTSTNDNLFFQLSKSPVTLYCVEHELVEGESGYAPYVSCNGQSRRALPVRLIWTHCTKNKNTPAFVKPTLICIPNLGPEADPRNQPADPICICDVYADRMIALQPAAEMDAACGIGIHRPDGTHSNPDCNCTGVGPSNPSTPSKWNVPVASATHIGMMPTWLPYVYVCGAISLPRRYLVTSEEGGFRMSVLESLQAATA